VASVGFGLLMKVILPYIYVV